MLQQREYVTFKTRNIAHTCYGLWIVVGLITRQLLEQTLTSVTLLPVTCRLSYIITSQVQAALLSPVE
jgi:hypothetical protein